MAIKNWKNIRNSTNIKVWKNKINKNELSLDSDKYRNQDESVIITLNNKQIKRIGEGMSNKKSKLEAITFVKAYMRKH